MKTNDKNYQSTNARLESPDQLSELYSWNLSFVMQEVDIDGTNHLIITNEGRIIWNEIAYWEYYDSFIRIGEVLIKKYGKRVMDFIPDVSWINIYGDSMSGAFIVHDFRMKIREEYNKRNEAEEKRKNPKKYLDKLINKLEQWN